MLHAIIALHQVLDFVAAGLREADAALNVPPPLAVIIYYSMVTSPRFTIAA